MISPGSRSISQLEQPTPTEDEVVTIAEPVLDAEDTAPATEPESPAQPRLFEEPKSPSEEDVSQAEEAEDSLDRIFAFEGEPSLLYIGSLLVASGLLVAAAALGAFPWLASVVGIVAFLATMFRGGRWVSAAGCLAMSVVVLVSAWPREPTLADVRTAGGAIPATGAAETVDEAPEGSLGFVLADVPALWNELDQGPRIRRGLVRTPERGQFDGFVYQFDDDASLAGAYDPDDEYVYALVASVRLRHESAQDYYLHLCYVVHPFSQECIDAYLEEGLGGESLNSYKDVQHSAEWLLDGVTWRLDIAGNVQQLRALGDRSG